MLVEFLDDPRDGRLADYARGRPGPAGVFVVEGRPLVTILLGAAPRFGTRSVLATPASLAALGPALAGAPAELPVYRMPREAIATLVGYRFHRGSLAVGEVGAPATLETLLAGAAPRLLVALERVNNPENVGAVLRNALAFGADGVLLGPGCADPLGRKALRVSAGAALVLPFVRIEDWPAALAQLGGAGFTLVALAPRASVSIDALAAPGRLPPRVALLLGAEWEGLGPAAHAAATLAVAIPMAPGVDSVNVATAAAIALHRLGGAGGWRRRGRDATTGRA